MKHFLAASLVSLVLIMTSQATAQWVPPATTFPLGGLMWGNLVDDTALWNQKLPHFGLNAVFMTSDDHEQHLIPYLNPGLTCYSA